MADIIQIRRDLALQWATVNPILASGEFGYEQDTFRLKIGNGILDWNSLPYIPGDLPVSDRIELSSDGYYDIPINYLAELFVIQPSSLSTIKLGSSVGGDEYMPETDIVTQGVPVILNIFANVVKRVYISGIISNTSVVILRRFIKQTGS